MADDHMKDATAEAIVGSIIDDLQGRRGLGDTYDALDLVVQLELQKTWRALVRRMLDA